MTNAPEERSGGKETLPRRRPLRDTSDVASGIARLIRALGDRIAMDDPEDLQHLRDLDDALAGAWRTAVAGIRTTGATDADIGRALGVTRQAVEQRWPRSAEA